MVIIGQSHEFWWAYSLFVGQVALGNLSNRGFPGDGDTTGRKSLGRGCRCSRQNV